MEDDKSANDKINLGVTKGTTDTMNLGVTKGTTDTMNMGLTEETTTIIHDDNPFIQYAYAKDKDDLFNR